MILSLPQNGSLRGNRNKQKPKGWSKRAVLLMVMAFLLMPQITWATEQSNDIFTDEELAWIKNHKSITVAPDPDYAPIEYYENGQFKGITVEFLEHAGQLYGLNFELVHYDTWGDILAAAKNRKVQVLSAAVMTPSRSEYLNFTTPYLTMPNQFFTRKGTAPIGNPDHLRTMKVGVIDGYSSEDYLRLVFPEVKLVEVVDIKEGLTRLSLGELDAFVGDSGQVSYYTDYYKITNIVFDSSVQIDFPLKLSIAVDKSDPILLSIMDKVVRNFPPTELNAIKSKWLNYKVIDVVNEGRFRSIILIVGILWILLVLAVVVWNRMLAKTVAAQTKQLRELIDFIPYPVFAKNHLQQFVIVNKAYADFFGLKPAEIEGRPDWEIYSRMSGDSQKKFGAHEKEVISEGKYVHLKEHKLVDANGNEHIYEIQKVPFPILNETEQGLLGISIDISELKKKENERIAGLSRLVSNVAHQLNTPLGNVISAFSFMMYQYGKVKDESEDRYFGLPEGSEAYHEFIESVEESDRVIGKSLARLVNIVNAFKSLSISADNLDLETFFVSGSIEDLVSRLDTSIQVEYVNNIDHAVLVTTYKPILMQIVEQIIRNAIEHGFKEIKEEGPQIEFNWHSDGDMATVSICDNGLGIPEKELVHVFDPLYSSAQYFGHLGLGLSIASNMAQQLLDGYIVIENRETGGVCVRVSFRCR